MGRHCEPNWQEKCLMIIESLSEFQCIGIANHQANKKCFPCEIFKIAHVGTASCGHKDWDNQVERLWINLNKKEIL
jgi:hypothetical protein